MTGSAIVTSTASDLTAALAAAAGIVVVPSTVTFGADEFVAGVDLSMDDFWDRMMAPDAPFPITAPPSPGAFASAYRAAFAAGADAIVSVQMSARMSATFDSARVAADTLPDRQVHVVDSGSASMATGLLALLAAEMASLGVAGAEIARVVARRAGDVHLFAALDTLEYLRRGGRYQGESAQPADPTSIKPIITISDGRVEVIDRAPSRREAHERVIKLLTRKPVERLAVLYSPPADAVAFRDAVVARLPVPLDASRVIVCPLGLTIGPHVGPGCLAGVALTAGG
jgi:DegV family protein with EDD domain